MHLNHPANNTNSNASKSVKFKLDNGGLPSQQEFDDDEVEIRSSYSSHQEQSPPPPPVTAMVEYLTSYISKRKLKVIDVKGYEDGHVDKLLEDGATITMFPNGTIKECEPSRQHIFVKFFNGDYKEIDHATNSETYFYAETNITQIIDLTSGLQMLKFPSGQVEKFHADKTREIIFPDKLVRITRPDGSEETRLPNGTSIRVEPNGDKVIEYPNRQREIHTKEFKKREYPDGSVKTVYTNGISETKYSNGRVRLKDSMGNIISDSKAA
jgi:centromere protein J